MNTYKVTIVTNQSSTTLQIYCFIHGKVHANLFSLSLGYYRIMSSTQFSQLLQKNTHTFNGPLSGSTRVSRYQKGKTNLDFTEARQWVAVASASAFVALANLRHINALNNNNNNNNNQLCHTQVCTLLQTDNHASTPPLSFLQAGCPSWCPTNSIKALKATNWKTQWN